MLMFGMRFRIGSSITSRKVRSSGCSSYFACASVILALVTASGTAYSQESQGATFFVRATIGSDSEDGLTPQSAWKTVQRAAGALGPGDTLIIGPGIYREHVRIEVSGTPEQPIKIQGDPAGELTGDPPGPVMMAGSIPVDESLFEPEGSPGVYKLKFDSLVYMAVEMDGSQHRYTNVREPVSDIPYVQRVRDRKSSAWYEKDDETLYIHTSDDRPPTEHELELITEHSAFFLRGASHVWISGLTLRHYGDATMYFQDGSDHVRAFDNVAYGSRHGFRILNSKNVEIVDNTMMLNENSGAYFLRGAEGAQAVGNTTYDNAVGLRWGSDSNGGLARNNVIVNNSDAGMGIEKVSGHVATRNAFEGNSSHLRVIRATYESDENCFEAGNGSDQVIATWDLVTPYSSLSAYSEKSGQDLNSRVSDCDIEFDRVDVHELHSRSLSYPRSEN